MDGHAVERRAAGEHEGEEAVGEDALGDGDLVEREALLGGATHLVLGELVGEALPPRWCVGRVWRVGHDRRAYRAKTLDGRRGSVDDDSVPVRMLPTYFSPRQVGGWVGVSSDTVAVWCDEGRVEAVRTPGGHRRIPEAAARRLLKELGKPLPPELVSVHRRVLALVSSASARRVAEELGAAVEVEIVSCSYEATVSFISNPAQYLLLDGGVGARATEMLSALLGKRGLLTQTVLVLVGVDEEVRARRVVRFPAGAVGDAAHALRRMLRPA